MPSPQKDRGERKEEQKKKSEEQLLAEQQEREIQQKLLVERQEREVQQKLLAEQQVDNFSKIVDINTPLTMPLLGKDYGTADNDGAINSDLTGESNCCCIIV